MQMHKNGDTKYTNSPEQASPSHFTNCVPGELSSASWWMLDSEGFSNFAVKAGVCEGQALHFFKGNLSKMAVEKTKFYCEKKEKKQHKNNTREKRK